MDNLTFKRDFYNFVSHYAHDLYKSGTRDIDFKRNGYELVEIVKDCFHLCDLDKIIYDIPAVPDIFDL